MTTSLPAPLTPADCDLRAFDWFPFFHKRLLKSSFWSRASDQACRISVDFWSIAYEQVPAASLPDDDFLLAEWAGFGRRNVDAWRSVKAEVMEPWIRCADGRWYHPTLSEVACKAWVEKRLHGWKRDCDRVRKENARLAKAGLPPLELPPKPSEDPFDNAVSVELSDGQREFSAGQTAKDEETDDVSEGNSAVSSGPPENVPRMSVGKQSSGDGIPTENALKEKGTETGTYLSFSLRSKDARAARDAFDREFWPKYPNKVGKAPAAKAFDKLWREFGGDIAAIIAGLERYVRSKPADRAWLNPATFLNQRRFEDEAPAPPNGFAKPESNTEPRVDFGGGFYWPETAVKETVQRWRAGQARWPDHFGSLPGQPGCQVPKHLLEDA